MDSPSQQSEPADPVLAKLVKQIATIEQNPNNLAPTGSLWRFTPKAQDKIDKLRHKVTNRLAELRAERSEPISEAGYTGPKQKRR